MNAHIRNNGSLARFKHNVFKCILAEQKVVMLLRLFYCIFVKFYLKFSFVMVYFIVISFCIYIL